MGDWRHDKKWSDKFIPEIKSILGVYLISEAPIEEDAKRNTDLMVLSLGEIRVGCRIRRFKDYRFYKDEFTIRNSRPQGTKTELEKIVKDGFGNYFFYGFANEKETNLHEWRLARFDVFRRWFVEWYREHKKMPGFIKNNVDNSSNFRIFKWADLPDDFVVAQGNAENTLWLMDYTLRMRKIDPESEYFNFHEIHCNH